MRQLKITKQVTNRETASLDKYLQEIGKVDLITAEEEVELAQRIKAGDEVALEKLTKVRQMIDASGRDIRLEIDGGINKDTIAKAAEAGADTFVAGSAIFNTDNYEQTISDLRSKIV